MHIIIVADSNKLAQEFADKHEVFKRPSLKNFRSDLEGYDPDTLFLLVVNVEPPKVFMQKMTPYLQNGQCVVTMM